MTGISIDSIAAILPSAPPPPTGVAKGRFAGLIADLSAQMTIGTVTDGELPIGVVLPGDRQDLAGDADIAAPTIGTDTDDDDDDSLVAIAPTMLPVPALAPSWKMPLVLTVAPIVAPIVPAVREATTDTTPDAAPPVVVDIAPMSVKPVVAETIAPAVTTPVTPAVSTKPEQPSTTVLPPINPSVPTADAPAKAEPAVVATPVVMPPTQPRPAVPVAAAMPVAPSPAADPSAPAADKPLPEGVAIAAVTHDRAAPRESGPVIANRAPVPPPMIAPAAIAAQMADQNSSDDRPASAGTAAIDAITAASPAPLAAPAAPIVTRPIAAAVLPQAVDTGRAEWIETLVDRIDELRGQSGQRETRIRLLPDALGTVDIRIQRDGDRVNVHFATDNPHARALLNEAAPRLVDMAEARGLKLGDTGVRQDSGTQARSDQPQSGQSQSGQPRPDEARRAAFRPTHSQLDAAPDESDARIA